MRHFAKNSRQRKYQIVLRDLEGLLRQSPRGAIFGSYLSLLRTGSLERAYTDFIVTCFLHSQHLIEARRHKICHLQTPVVMIMMIIMKEENKAF